MSIDVLWAVPDKPAAIRECARVLNPGARFVFTAWDRTEVPPGYHLPAFSNYRPALDAAGFTVEAYDVREGAEALRRAVYVRVVAAEQELIREIGAEATEKIMHEARGNLALVNGREVISYSQRIFVVATASG
jgi:SAM-dependent methyltransferase